MTAPGPDIFQAVGDPSRREILRLLSSESRTINALAENFAMSRPAVSKHIKVLETAGFISIEDRGRERYCTLKQDGFVELQQWIDFFEGFWKWKLNKLGHLLDNPSKDVF